jgi:competence protein ComEC
MTLFYLALAWSLGMALADSFRLAWPVWMIGAGPALLGLILLRSKPVLRTMFGCLLLFSLGAARYTASIPRVTETDLAQYNDQGQVSLQGMISDAPEVSDTGVSMVIDVQSLTLPDGSTPPVRGLALVRSIAVKTYRYGDIVTASGSLVSPPASEQGFSYRDYLARRGITSLIDFGKLRVTGQRKGSPLLAALYDFRADAYQKIARLLPEPEASLLQGILLGLDQGISPRIRSDFNADSASHIIAISGMNIAIVAGLLMTLTRRLMPENPAVAVTIIGLVVYSLFVGANPSVLRAAIMSILALIATRLGRQTYGPASLGFSALVMTAIQPNALWDVGFQLSFLATFGLIFYVEPLQNLLTRWLATFLSEGRVKQVLDLMSESLVVTVAAQIATLPLIILIFKRFSVVSLPANFLIIPVQAQIMVWGILSIALAYVFWPLAQLAAWVAWLFLAWTIEIVRIFAALPLAFLSVSDVSPILIGGIYLLMLFMIVAAQQPKEQRAGWWAAFRQNLGVKALAGAGLVIAILIGLAAASLPDGQLHVRFINTGAASASLITTPSGRHILIDAGGSGRALSLAVGDALPFWNHSLDMVILTQPTEAHIAALPDVLGHYQIETLITNGTSGGQLDQSIQSAAMAQNAHLIIAQPGSHIALGDGVALIVLASRAGDSTTNDPGDPVSLLLTYGQTRILFPGSLTPDAASTLLHQNIAASVVFLPDLSNATLTDPSFLSAISPQIVIAGPATSPPPDALARLTAPGIELHRLDQASLIELITDGTRIVLRDVK